MKKEKSLCKSCSNRVVIKFHGEHEGNIIKSMKEDQDCFYNFRVVALVKDRYKNGHHINMNVSHLIIDECSFYNKSLNRLNKSSNNINQNDDDDSDNNTDNGSGVAFTNIPGALLP
jgi:hypothetical protein